MHQQRIQAPENLMAKSNESEFHQPDPPHSPLSPASTLPPEILSLIFRHACTIPDLNERHGLATLPQQYEAPPLSRETRTQFILSAVCVYWRHISLLTRHIWTYVDLYIGTSIVNDASAILQIFFTHSGQLPLAVVITFDDFWANNTKSLVDAPSDAVLRENAHRIEELYLYGVPDSWIDFLPSLSHLVDLCIETPSFEEPRPVIIRSKCSHLTLKSFRGSVDLSCPNLATLHLHGTHVDVCLKMLMTSPNLIEFRTRELWFEAESWITLPEDFPVFPYMETFEWSVDTTSLLDAAMLRNIRMPALRELIWVEEIYYDFEPIDPANVFFRNLPSTLVELHLHKAMAHPTASGLVSIFDHVSDSLGIERLIFSDTDSPFLDYVFDKLTPAPENSGSQQRLKLPKLNAILIKSVQSSFRSLTEINQATISHMLERRFLGVGGLNREPFRLEFPPEVTLEPHFKESLKEMDGCGLKVEIFRGSELVDWV